MSKNESVHNKYKLKRYIPQDIRAIIRKEAGYGCVICGSLFCDYEHIEPEFHNAKVHDPDAMTLLCGGCHAKVTGKRLSKNSVWKAKASPITKTNGYVQELLEPSEHHQILLGKTRFELKNAVFSILGKPIIWFEAPETPEGPILVNAIFSDDNGKPSTFINRNQFTSLIGENDVRGIGTRIEIRLRRGKIALILNSTGGESITIERLNIGYFEHSIEIKPDGKVLMTSGDATITMDGCGFSFNGGGGFNLGVIPVTRRIDGFVASKLYLALKIASSNNEIRTNCGVLCGWVLNDFIINKKYEIPAQIKTDKHGKNYVQSVLGEFIGYISSSGTQHHIEMPLSEYETYEPIWIHPLDIQSRFIRMSSNIDLSYRILECE